LVELTSYGSAKLVELLGVIEQRHRRSNHRRASLEQRLLVGQFTPGAPLVNDRHESGAHLRRERAACFSPL
jgi:hypothetical protein